MAGTHAILSPSAAHRWLVCTPSARFEEQIPDEGSAYAAEGTLAHRLAALLLEARAGVFRGTQRAFDAILEQLTGDALYTPEMFEHCENYAAFVVDKIEPGGAVLVEHSYDLSKYLPQSFGTADATCIGKEAVHVIDFKYGVGVAVSATANKQMMCYALGALDEARARGLSPETVTMSIYQPRTGGHSSWSLPAADLLKWAETEARPRALLAIAGGGDFVAGPHCRFCKARTRCRAFYKEFADLLNIRDEREMTDEQIAAVLTRGADVASWIKAVEADCTARLEKGGSVSGFKLVEGRGSRAFRDEADAVDILLGAGYESDDIFETSLRSLTAIEKLTGAKRFRELFGDSVTRIPGRPKIAPADDERPAIGASAAADYDS